MPQHHFLQRATVLAAATLIMGVVHAAPVTVPFSATATVLQQIEIKEKANLAFGKIDKPSTGSQRFTVMVDGTPQVTGDGAGGSFIGGHQVGRYDFLGSANTAAVLITSGEPCSDTSIRLAGVELELPDSVVLPIMNARLGGTLVVTPTSNAGTHTCPYTITARYQ